LEEASPWRHLHRLRSSLVGGEGRHGDIAQASRAAPAAVALAVDPPRLRCFHLLPPRADALDEGVVVEEVRNHPDRVRKKMRA
jgi:hypothetical protein